VSPTRVLRPIQRFARLEQAGGLVLLAATVAALVWANVAAGSYAEVWGHEIDVGPVSEDLQHLVNDGLMAVFFLVVGLEVKRELAVGELSGRGAALLPLVAAVGGMIVPALVFLAVMRGEPGANGWGIPMATDIAFALTALAALGSRVPPALTAFLLGVAVIDDIGAILVIAVYYTDGIALGWLAAAFALLAAVPLTRRVGLAHPLVLVPLGVLAWYATYRSGVHATIAGVALGLLTPVEVIPRLEDRLHGWSSYVVLPVFALANAGIALGSEAVDAVEATPVAAAVAVGLVVGKTIGLTTGAALAIRFGPSALPRGVGWAHIVGTGALAGIGFTVSLFVAGLAYEGSELEEAAKIGILGGSIVAAALGLLLLALATRRPVSR
jgi:NhaA family Na+:H+ antiporter